MAMPRVQQEALPRGSHATIDARAQSVRLRARALRGRSLRTELAEVRASMSISTAREAPDSAPQVVAAAFEAVDRNRFLLTAASGRSSDWVSVPTARTVHALVDAIARPRRRVLVCAAGTGYLPAVLSHLVEQVFATDARASVARLGATLAGRANVSFSCAAPLAGRPDAAPFDAIVVAEPLSSVPEPLLQQLSAGGVLVVALGLQRVQRLVRVVRTEKGFAHQTLGSIQLHGRLGDLVVENGAAARAVIEEAANEARGEKLGVALAARGVDEGDVHRALALQSGLRYAPTSDLLAHLDPTVARALPRPFLEHARVLPIQRIGERVTIATTDPQVDLLDVQHALRAGALDVCVVTPTDYRRLWGAVDLASSAVSVPSHAVHPRDLLDNRDEAVTAHAVSFFDALLLDAIAERASDIHLEIYGEQVRVRLRIDGDLHDLPRFALSPDELRAVVNVVKVSAELDIAEKRMPQGGRIRRQAGGQTFDLRVQTQPALWGEHVVIRLLPQEMRPLSIEDLGFPAPVAKDYLRLLDSPAGLVLVVGPTGSGKSTTLYAGLQALAKDATRKVLSVEDPIEYAVAGVQQSAVRPEIGFQFAQAMRAFVREDPDVILVGEIRDGETALEAIRASQTGHVVLSTLHCNDATDAVQRLVDLGMHPNSIGSELLAVVAQRLAKRNCEACRVETAPDPEVLAELFPGSAPPDLRCFVGRGCERCEGHGTRGRIAVIEWLRVGPAIRRAISRRLPVDELRDAALGAGLVTMRRSALELVRAGVLALGELRWVLSADRMAPERPDDVWA
jgi:type IV pilus assembly protein PilB